MQQKNYISQDRGFFSGFEPPPAPHFAGTKEASNTLPPSPSTGTAGAFLLRMVRHSGQPETAKTQACPVDFENGSNYAPILKI